MPKTLQNMFTKNKKITFIESINQALSLSMKKDKNVICYGLGTTDPKKIFGSTKNLEEKFGNKRVFDIPTSENAMTGIAIGASLNGLRPIFIHQRLDFCLLAMDQIINNAAKWHFMFGGQKSVPITIRLITGRGWGQGPTHSQNLQSLFAHIPGLKVVMPSNPYNAKGLLLGSIFDNNPVIYIENRWLHNSTQYVPNKFYTLPIGKAEKKNSGKHITIVSMSYMTVEAIRASKILNKANIEVEIIDLLSIRPLDMTSIQRSVRKTGRLLVLDTSHPICSVGSEIISQVVEKSFKFLKASPIKLNLPDTPEPTSYSLTKNYYNNFKTIVNECMNIMNFKNKKKIFDILTKEKVKHHDIPGEWFKGPF